MTSKDKSFTELQNAFIKEMNKRVELHNTNTTELSKIFKAILKYQEERGMLLDEMDLLFLKAANFEVSTADDYEMTFRRLSEIDDEVKSYNLLIDR